MVKKGFIAFGKPKKTTKNKKPQGGESYETKNPTGVNLPKK